MSAILYWKSTCSTAREVRSVLRERYPQLAERNYAKVPLSPDEVRALVQAAGGVAPLLNSRHELAKASGWRELPPDEASFAAAAAADGNLLRRPILLVAGRALIGNQPQAMLAALALAELR